MMHGAGHVVDGLGCWFKQQLLFPIVVYYELSKVCAIKMQHSLLGADRGHNCTPFIWAMQFAL